MKTPEIIIQTEERYQELKSFLDSGIATDDNITELEKIIIDRGNAIVNQFVDKAYWDDEPYSK